MLAERFLPTWLIDERAITLATWGLVFVTALLVLGTFALWLDSIKKGREQRARWSREDAQHKLDRDEERARWTRDDNLREERKKPRFAFGIQSGSFSGTVPTITLWCANLGEVAFQLKSILFRLSNSGDDEPIRTFHPQRIVNSGEMIHQGVPHQMFKDLLFTVDIEVSLEVETAHSTTVSGQKAFSFLLVETGIVAAVEEGYQESRKVPCGLCNSVGILRPKGILSKRELEEILGSASRDLVASCPVHRSAHLTSVVGPEGSITFLENG